MYLSNYQNKYNHINLDAVKLRITMDFIMKWLNVIVSLNNVFPDLIEEKFIYLLKLKLTLQGWVYKQKLIIFKILYLTWFNITIIQNLTSIVVIRIYNRINNY